MHVLLVVLQNQDSHVLISGLYLISTDRLTSMNPFLAGFLVSHTRHAVGWVTATTSHTAERTHADSELLPLSAKKKKSHRTLQAHQGSLSFGG